MQPEVWLRGPLPGITPWLQPVAHALLQAQEEVNALMMDFPDELLWDKPAGLASPGFHLQHLAGVADRLCTYARGEALSPTQLQALAMEQAAPVPGTGVTKLLDLFNKQVALTIEQLGRTDAAVLLEPRGIGRAQLPSTMLGLLFHMAEHTQRHFGQLYVTVKVLMAEKI